MDETKVETTETVTENTPSLTELEAEINRLKEENAKLKTSVTNASADASKFKKQWQATLSEQERKETELKEQREAELAELTQLRNEKRISGYKARLMDAGYDSKTAETMAGALPEGIGDDYFAAQKAFIEEKIQATKKEMLDSQPSVRTGEAPKAQAAEEAEREKLRRYAMGY